MEKLLRYELPPAAIKDLNDLRFFLREREEIDVFDLMRKRIKTAITLLRKFPKLGTYREEVGARSFPVPKTKYIIFFREKDDLLEILRVYHSSLPRLKHRKR
ncbi:MAG: type II toxin-antitoxin system RelE/ParE family toxin [Candidatus Peregrinibacteria bacterium]|nr:type II toxin-antitoxin system RelE/ParE family toxin [Candidatus Peregrinibacteria bacterium]